MVDTVFESIYFEVTGREGKGGGGQWTIDCEM
jgi:hypothetical protein